MNTHTEFASVRERFYRRERRSVPAARRFAAAALEAWELESYADQVLLCVSELCTNALVHGVPPGRGFRLFLRWDGDVLTVEVHDSGDGAPKEGHPDSGDETGRGLMLVSALADEWGVGERNPGKIVWCSWGRPRL